MWLSDLLPQKVEIRPTRPTSKNDVGRLQTLVYVASSDTSDTSDIKKAENILSGENHQKEEGSTQVSYKNPESVRLLPETQEPVADSVLYLSDIPTAARILDEPTPEQLAHVRRMLVTCPASGGKLHCWHCSRCGDARTCTAWHHRRQDVTFFRQSGPPFSLTLAETEGGMQ